MNGPLTADMVLRDIEFEIIQGAVSQDDLGQGILAVRRFQNKARREIFEADRQATNSREIAARQFQINDMLLTLLQETATRLQQLQVELRQAALLLPDAPPVPPPEEASLPDRPAPPTEAEPAGPAAGPVPEGHIPAAIENAMHAEALRIEMEVRPVRLPIIGGLLTRLRSALHSLALFYVRRLASQQAPINATYGEWIMHLDRFCRQQQAQIKALQAQLAQARTAEE